MKREDWYIHYLSQASEAERAGDKKMAATFLEKARKHTRDSDEIAHLDLWLNRLKKEAA